MRLDFDLALEAALERGLERFGLGGVQRQRAGHLDKQGVLGLALQLIEQLFDSRQQRRPPLVRQGRQERTERRPGFRARRQVQAYQLGRLHARIVQQVLHSVVAGNSGGECPGPRTVGELAFRMRGLESRASVGTGEGERLGHGQISAASWSSMALCEAGSISRWTIFSAPWMASWLTCARSCSRAFWAI